MIPKSHFGGDVVKHCAVCKKQCRGEARLLSETETCACFLSHLSVYFMNCSRSSHRRHDRRPSLTLTDSQQKAAALEQTDPAHRSALGIGDGETIDRLVVNYLIEQQLF